MPRVLGTHKHMHKHYLYPIHIKLYTHQHELHHHAVYLTSQIVITLKGEGLQRGYMQAQVAREQTFLMQLGRETRLKVEGDTWCNGQQVCFPGKLTFTYFSLSVLLCHSGRREEKDLSVCGNHLVGLVVKASASRAEGPGFESRLRRDFFRGRVIPVT